MKTSDLKLPSKFTDWRPGQWETIEEIIKSNARIFFLDSPPGTGKSIIAVAAATVMMASDGVLKRMTDTDTDTEYRGDNWGDRRYKTTFVTRTKQLQDQLLADFPEARTVKGRSNYPCAFHELRRSGKFPQVTAEDCVTAQRVVCIREGSCAYQKAKGEAVEADIAVVNSAYFLAEANGPGLFSQTGFVILDEVDAFESDLMNFIELVVSEKTLRRHGLDLPGNTDSLAQWIAWVDHTRIALGKVIDELETRLADIRRRRWSKTELELNRHLKWLKGFDAKLAAFLQIADESWIIQIEVEDGLRTWHFKPAMVARYAERYLFKHGRRFLGMSGTLLAPDVVRANLGISTTGFAYKQLTSPFPVEHRPIYVWPVVNMTNKTMEIELPALTGAVAKLMEKYPDKKMLVHTTSNRIRSHLMAYLPGPRLITHDQIDRNGQLEIFKKSAESLVMLSPSFDRGVDLPGDLCRCIVVCKMPFASLGDPQVAKRLSLPGGNDWYQLKTCQTLIQMTGRGVRNIDDYCDTYILDRQFQRLRMRAWKFFPEWWLKAIRSVN